MMGPNPHTISVLALASIWSHQPCLAPLQKLRFATKDTSHSIPQKEAVSLAKKANQDHQLGPLLSQPPARLPNTQYLPVYSLQVPFWLPVFLLPTPAKPSQSYPRLDHWQHASVMIKARTAKAMGGSGSRSAGKLVSAWPARSALGRGSSESVKQGGLTSLPGKL